MANDKTIKAMIISSITIYTGRMLERNHLREQHPRRRLYTFVGGKGGGGGITQEYRLTTLSNANQALFDNWAVL